MNNKFVRFFAGSLGLLPVMLMGFSTGPPAGRTGAPVDGGTACIACHRTGVLNDGQGLLTIATAAYTPGVKQKITVSLQHPSAQRWGFEISARLASDDTKKAGTFSVPDDLRMVCGLAASAPPCGNDIEFVTHTQPQTGAGTSGGRTWEFEWTPPETNVGAVVFYAAGNAANNNDNFTGDFIYTTSQVIGPASSSAPKPAISAGGVQDIYTFITTSFASHSWLAISGHNLASQTKTWDSVVNGGALPFMLGGVVVKIDGRAAPVQFVSPTQVTVVAPLDGNNGDVDVVVANENGVSDPIKVHRVDSAPAIRSAPGADGRKYAVAFAADGTVIGKPGTDPDVRRAARPGETISLLASGCGTTDPLSPADRLVTTTPTLLTLPVMTLNNQPMTVKAGSLIFPGFYQIDITVPDGIADGDYAIVANTAGSASPSQAFLTIAR